MDKSTAHKLDDDVQNEVFNKSDSEVIKMAKALAPHLDLDPMKIMSMASTQEIKDLYKKYVLKESSCGCCGESPCGCDDDCGCKESVNESPTVDTTQLITLLKNSGFTAEAIEEKINEWANTPEGVGEVEPTEHGEAYEMAQAVNLSLKRYLDAQDMKVQVSESHTVAGMKEAYKAKKNK